MTRGGWIGVAQAAAAAGLFSTGAILVRCAQALSPVEVTSLRMLLGGLLLAGVAWGTASRLRLTGAEVRRVLLVGLVTAAHFLSFIASLYFTTVAHSLTLTHTAPLFVAALSWSLLKERLPPRALAGIGLGLCGVAVLTGFEARLTGPLILGDLLAVGAALAFALYSLLGRRERTGIPLLSYAASVYLAAGLMTAPFSLGLLARPLPWTALAAVVALALFPLALGHTLYNAALRRLHPSIPQLIATQEILGGTLLAWLLLGEPPSWNVVAGAVLTVLGVSLVLR
jgi:drug/metabolite transporter (DMT)-like permease